jgi:hypothetical protein
MKDLSPEDLESEWRRAKNGTTKATKSTKP